MHLDVSDPDAWRALFGIVRPARPPPPERRASTTPRSTTSPRSPTPATAPTSGVNVDGVFFGLREAIPLLEQAKGAVVVTSSMAGIIPLPANPLYSRTKWALIGFVRSVHGELERRGIRINALCPGAVATPLMGDDPHAWFESAASSRSSPRSSPATVVETARLRPQRRGGPPPSAVAIPRCSSSRGCRRRTDGPADVVDQSAAPRLADPRVSTPGTGGCRCCSASTSTSRRARRSRCSAPTARARPRCCARSAAC